jgi:anaerobic magnesium-protoporphyrin IX monomethyl ester cyclase
MLSILVCHSYFLRFDQKQQERAKPYPPLATLQVAAQLRQAGHKVSLFDAMLADGTAEYGRLLQHTRPQLVLFYEDNFNFLSKMCLGKMRDACCEMVASARQAGARVVAAGSDATDAPEPYLQAGADVVLLGEGLETLAAVVSRLETNQTQMGWSGWLPSRTGRLQH